MRELQLGMTRKKTISLFTVLALAATISISPVQHRVAEAGVLGGAIGGALLGGLVGGRGGLIGGAIIGGVVGGVAKHHRQRRDRAYYHRGRMDSRYRGRRRR